MIGSALTIYIADELGPAIYQKMYAPFVKATPFSFERFLLGGADGTTEAAVTVCIRAPCPDSSTKKLCGSDL